MYPILFQIGPLKIPAYGTALAISMMLGIFLARKRAERDGVSPEKIENLFFWIMVSAIVGARFLYTFVEHADHYWSHPLDFFKFRSGGLSFFGGLILALSVSIFYCFRKGLSFWKVADVMTPSIALGLGITKLGCFFAGCCYGEPCNLPWAVIFNNPEGLAEPKGVPLHPSQLYESLMSISIFFLLVWFRTRRRLPGEVLFLFLVVYGIGRSLLEILRNEPGRLGFLTTAQTLSIPLVATALGFWVFQRFRLRAEPRA